MAVTQVWHWGAALLVAAGLGGCTSYRWEHPGFGSGGVEEALAECRYEARIEAEREAYRDRLLTPAIPIRDRNGRIVYWREADSFRRSAAFRENDLRDSCMRSRGFRLVPVEE